MPLPEGLQAANRSTTATPSEAPPGPNTQLCARVNSLVCKRCQADPILRAGQPKPLPATRPEPALGCWRSFQGWVVSADGEQTRCGLFCATVKLCNLAPPNALIATTAIGSAVQQRQCGRLAALCKCNLRSQTLENAPFWRSRQILRLFQIPITFSISLRMKVLPEPEAFWNSVEEKSIFLAGLRISSK